MTGSEHSLDVYVGKSPIAKLTLRNDQLLWQYNQKWQQTGYAVSPHLPLNNDIPPINVQRFLRNLLPEGNALDELVSCFQLSKYNTYALIRALGLDISGALIILPTGENYPKNGSFREISDAELIARLEQKDNRSLLIWDGKPRLSVAGVQDKINVVINQEGQMGFGEGALCSTHILKFEKRKLSHLVLNEYITMQLAKHCGLTVANVNLKYFGEHPTLLVERFDRQLISQSSVKRRHVIDGCQAVNVSPEYKYERNFGSARDVAHIRDGVSYAKLFEFTDNCSNPALTKQKILDCALFNALIFYYDALGNIIS
ncbi:MAG: HipA domain-containing protein, partial [Candidatus Berkiella sp.]